MLPQMTSAHRTLGRRLMSGDQNTSREIICMALTVLMAVAAADGLGFMPMPTVVTDEGSDRYGFRPFGRPRQCRMQFYAISAERNLTHPAVVAITERARKLGMK